MKSFTQFLEDAVASTTAANISPNVIPVMQLWMDRHKEKLSKQAMNYFLTKNLYKHSVDDEENEL